MKLYIALAVGGIPIGAMYALQALGIVIVYKTSKVFNFAAGAIGLTCAYVGSTLHAHGFSPLAALPLVVALGVVLGALIELSVRPVQGTLSKTVVTLGWLLVLQGGVGWVYGTQSGTHDPARLFPTTNAIDVGGVLLYSWEQVGLILVAAALAAVLAVFFRRTALGTATRAVSEAPDAARLLGIGVDRVNLVAWGLGGAVSGLAGMLVAPLLGGLDTVHLVVLTVQALAAAVVGRLSSLPRTVAGGLLLGMLQPVVKRLLSDVPSVKGVEELTAFVVVLIALLLMR
ncbi:MAG: branched-chain amino acid ABC transporter permease, partial [Actinomycetota bacterium]|nr:branched-chain amino acid ABC transporter permease [Actinomycetota bacterium]